MYRFISQPAVLVGLCLVVCLTGVVSVQAGPLPVTSGLYMWVDASTITGASDGGAVDYWASATAGLNSFYGKTYPNYAGYITGPDPTYHSSGSAFGGKAYVDFSAGGNMISNTPTGALLGDLTTTVFAVATTPAGGAMYGWGNPGATAQGFGLFNGLRGSSVYSAEFAGGTPATFGSAASGVQITELVKSAGAINATTSLLVNGTAESVASGSSSLTPDVVVGPSASFLWLGGYATATSAWTTNVYAGKNQIAELIIFNRALTADESNQVGYYLQQKYSISGGYTTTPEPGSFALLATGLIGLICYAWRKRK